MSIILFLIILVILIVSHEFGHFIVAKKSGIRVDEFAIGFPPRLWSTKRGETEYSVNALPFGGFVKIFGENPDEESMHGVDSKRSLSNQPRRIQAAVIGAGVVFNLLLAWVLISFGFMLGFPTSLSGSEYEAYSKESALTVISVSEGGPADKAGLKPGDKLLSLSFGGDLIAPSSSEDVREFIGRHGKDAVSLSYESSGKIQETSVIPEEGILSDRPAIGIATDIIAIVTLPPHLAVWEGAKSTYFLTSGTVQGLVKLVKGAFTGEGGFSSITGPVGIVKMVGDANALGFSYLIGFTALISINLAVVNLIPVPALDGGRLLFVLIEAVRKKPIKPQVANTVNAVGFALLIILMVAVTYNDIVKLVS